MINKKGYYYHVDRDTLEIGDIIAHDCYPPYYIYDGDRFLEINRVGNGKLEVSKRYAGNFDEDASFYRMGFMGNVKDGIKLIDRQRWGDGWRDVDLGMIPKDILDMIGCE